MITTDKDFVKAVLRVWEIGDLIPRVVEQLSNPSPLRNKVKDCDTLISLGKELCELSSSIPSPGQRLICENGMINTEAENANRDDVESITDVHAQEIDAMTDDEIDASVPDSVAARGEELVKVKQISPTSDLLLDVITGHIEISRAAYQAGKESK